MLAPRHPRPKGGRREGAMPCLFLSCSQSVKEPFFGASRLESECKGTTTLRIGKIFRKEKHFSLNIFHFLRFCKP